MVDMVDNKVDDMVDDMVDMVDNKGDNMGLTREYFRQLSAPLIISPMLPKSTFAACELGIF